MCAITYRFQHLYTRSDLVCCSDVEMNCLISLSAWLFLIDIKLYYSRVTQATIYNYVVYYIQLRTKTRVLQIDST